MIFTRFALPLAFSLVLSACGDKNKTKTSGGGSPPPSTARMKGIDEANRTVSYKELGYDNGIFTFGGKPYTGKAEKNVNGVLLGSYVYLEGQLHGPTREYYPSGKISVSTNFKEGKRDGANVYFNEDGSQMKAQVYQMDKLIKSTDPTELQD